MNDILCPISGQTKKEERFNTFTHFLGFILSVIGFFYLIIVSIQSENMWTLFSSIVYGLTLMLLYGASSYYHSRQTLEQKQTFKIIDHACIYLLIAGSYTPFTLGPLREFNGWKIMAIEWMIAIIGITLKIIAVDRFQKISLLAYLGMGWLVVFSYDTLMLQMPATAVFWLIAGGISYTVGTCFYIWDRLPFNHGIWHLFVLMGSLSHYICVLQMV
jgi:hemolysin III